MEAQRDDQRYASTYLYARDPPGARGERVGRRSVEAAIIHCLSESLERAIRRYGTRVLDAYGAPAQDLAEEEMARYPAVGSAAGRAHIVVNDDTRYVGIEGLVASAGVMSYSKFEDEMDAVAHLDIIVHVAGFADVVRDLTQGLAREHPYLRKML